jgi:hypothetical protein
MEKTLQQQYNLIKEGKISKDDFLKSARRVFPEYISPLTNYADAVTILKGKSILSENMDGIVTDKKDWFKTFKQNLQEAVGVKDKEEYGDQNTFKASKETIETLKKANFDNANPENIDNVYGQSFLLGFLAEMDDPKNKNKTVDEVKKIVAKNMAKDINYYSKNAMFSVKGIKGQQLEKPKEPKGKHKSSGYGDMPKIVKENKETKPVGPMVKPEEFQVGDKVEYKGMNHEITRIIDDRIYIKSLKYGGRPDTWVKAVDLKKIVKESQESQYKVGDKVEFKDGEVWVVAKPGVKGNKVFMKPSNEKAKENNISMAIEFTFDYIKKNSKSSLKENQSKSYMISKSGSKSNPTYVLEKPDGSEQLDMFFDSEQDAKEYARKKGLKIVSSTKESKLRSLISQIIKEELNEISWGPNDADFKEEEWRNRNMEGDFEYLGDATAEAQRISSKEGVVQHVIELPDGSYTISDWYDKYKTVASFENGIEL